MKTELEQAKIVLKMAYNKEKGLRSNRQFPWDRGYMEGYADGIEYAYDVICRIERESQEALVE